jgi:TRAP-type mannitol/chloroaromatic compound transport system substrate-binding protein
MTVTSESLIENLLNERAKTHGDFNVTAKVAQDLKHVLRMSPTWHKKTDVQREALDMMASKLARMVAGDSDFPDHRDDFDGYERLSG